MSRCHDVIVTILNVLTHTFSVIVPIYPEIDEK